MSLCPAVPPEHGRTSRVATFEPREFEARGLNVAGGDTRGEVGPDFAGGDVRAL